MGLFRQAVKHESKLRLALAGPSGSGKTYTALAVATHLVPDGKVALVDTEYGSASKYAGDLFNFDVAEMSAPYDPRKYVKAIDEAARAGYDVLIIDSLSHAWFGTGGILEIVDKAAVRFKGNSYAAWGEGTPIHNALIEAIVSAPLHIIATMRSKTEYVLQEVRGKQVPQKVGMAPIQRDNVEYEFDVFVEMDMDNNGIIRKTRCPALTNAVLEKPGADLAGTLREWLHGAPVTVKPSAATNDNEPDTVEFDDIPGASDEAPPDTRAETSPQAQAERKRPEPVNGSDPSGARQAAEVKAALIAASQDGGSGDASEAQLKYVRSSLSSLVDNDYDKAKLLLVQLFGIDSSNELTKGQASALIDWIGSTKESNWQPAESAQTEAQRLLRAFEVERGQQEIGI